jgi:hypothetical protein
MRRAIWSNLLYGTGGSTGGGHGPGNGTKGGEGAEEIVKILGTTGSGVVEAGKEVVKEVVLEGDSVGDRIGSGESSGHIENNSSHAPNSSGTGTGTISHVGTTDSSRQLDHSTFPGTCAVQGNTAGSRSGGVRGGGGVGRGILQLASDVDVAAISCKYELSGGFIKNAVLSALLSAISRCTLDQTPVLTQVHVTTIAVLHCAVQHCAELLDSILLHYTRNNQTYPYRPLLIVHLIIAPDISSSCIHRMTWCEGASYR